MSKLVADQADGLRRMLAHTPTRVVAFAAADRGMGVTTAAMSLAAALVQQGKDVLLVDEQGATEDSAASVWSVDAEARAACGVAVRHASRIADVDVDRPRAIVHVAVANQAAVGVELSTLSASRKIAA